MLTHIKSNDNQWTVVLDGKPYTFNESHVKYNELVDHVMYGNVDEFLNILDAGKMISNWSQGDFEFRDGYLYFQNEQVAQDPTNRIIELIKNKYPHGPMLNYLSNLYQNVSQRAVKESYKWSSHKGLPITEDGMLVGYKGVIVYNGIPTQDIMGRELTTGCLVDKYTGRTFRNNIGDVCSMNRRQVCDDHTVACSAGLHVGTYEYASDWAGPGGVVVLVKFNPKDIVSVPSDCNCQKLRVSSYEVISIARDRLEDVVYHEDELDNDYEEEEDDDYDYEYDNEDDDDYDDDL